MERHGRSSAVGETRAAREGSWRRCSSLCATVLLLLPAAAPAVVDVDCCTVCGRLELGSYERRQASTVRRQQQRQPPPSKFQPVLVALTFQRYHRLHSLPLLSRFIVLSLHYRRLR